MNKTIIFIVGSLSFFLVALLFADFFWIEHHGHFHVAERPGFYGAFSFIAFSVLVYGAKYILRPLVYRKEDLEVEDE